MFISLNNWGDNVAVGMLPGNRNDSRQSSVEEQIAGIRKYVVIHS